MKRLVSVMCVVFLLLSALVSCQEAPEPYVGATAVDCAYEELSETEKTVYNSLLQKIGNDETEYQFPDADGEEVGRAYLAVIADHPGFFWLSNGYSCRTTTMGSRTFITLAPITLETDALPGMREEFDRVVGEIVAQAKTLPSTFEQILYVHDYIIDHTVYDHEAYDLVTSGQATDVILDGATAYGCLVNGRAICSGYAAAFQYIAQQLGYRCARVSGTKTDGESHEWNYILLDDEYYYIDVTWDDPIAADSDENFKSYEFFCITTDELLLTHTVDDGQSVPECTAAKYDYYAVGGLFIEEYSFAAVAELVNRHSGADRIEIKFSSAAECERARQDLIDRDRVFEINADLGSRDSVYYSVSESGLIFTLLLS